jgi:Fe-S-cluster-containing hydrogenase component 2
MTDQSGPWEVERRRFEILGGKIISGQPVGLQGKGGGLWHLKIKDEHGIRVMETSRVVGVGPFDRHFGWREWPAGSFLFELEQSAGDHPGVDQEGWTWEEIRARRLAAKIIKGLGDDLSVSRETRERIEKVQHFARRSLRRMDLIQQRPFQLDWDGKWLTESKRQFIQSFPGVPQRAHLSRPVASLECFDDIPCNFCEQACPERAIQIRREADGDQVKTVTFLNEAQCTACGKCLPACPSRAAILIQENEDGGPSRLTFPVTAPIPRSVPVTLLNRRGEVLGSGRVVSGQGGEESEDLVTIEVPHHLTWEVRGVRPQRLVKKDLDFPGTEIPKAAESGVTIQLDGDSRTVRDAISISQVLFEVGKARPGDTLLCPDGSCGRCSVVVDGVRRSGCQVQAHQGAAVVTSPEKTSQEDPAVYLCPCRKITVENVLE